MATREQQVGISFYLTQTPGFTAILKQRYTDFKVNEVNLKGEVLRLKSIDFEDASQQNNKRRKLEADSDNAAATDKLAESNGATEPKDGKEQTVSVAVDAPTGQQSPDVSTKPELIEAQKAEVEEQVRLFTEMAGLDAAEKLKNFVLNVVDRNTDPTKAEDKRTIPDPIFLPAEEDKEKRKQVHDFFKKPIFANVYTETVGKQALDNSAASSIKVFYDPPKKKRKNRGAKRRGGWSGEWPGGKNEFLHFNLYKDNMETQAAVSLLAKFTHLPRIAFGVAGTKDKRASTVQGVTLHKIHPSRLASINPDLRGVKCGDFSYVPYALHLGSLSGNLFDVVLRNVGGKPSEVALAANALQKSGFVNYFGLQRFGNEGASTHLTGSLLAKGEWEKAVKLIMAPRQGGQDAMAEARALYEKGDLGQAARLMPSFAAAEKAVLQGLVNKGHTNYLAALLDIPLNLRSMFLHSLQSYLWNTAASHRASQHGLENPILGDLVLPRKEGPNVNEKGEIIDEPASKARLEDIHIVTSEDLVSNRFSIEDVVLPLPGSQIKYPQHDTAEIYKEEAEKLGISLETCEHKVKQFSFPGLPGDYRRLMHRPSDLEWQLLLYTECDQDLSYTDLDSLQGKSQPAFDIWNQEAGDELPEGKLLALQLKFQLPPSCYATMLIRELMKGTTSSTQHRADTMSHRNNGGAD